MNITNANFIYKFKFVVININFIKSSLRVFSSCDVARLVNTLKLKKKEEDQVNLKLQLIHILFTKKRKNSFKFFFYDQNKFFRQQIH